MHERIVEFEAGAAGRLKGVQKEEQRSLENSTLLTGKEKRSQPKFRDEGINWTHAFGLMSSCSMDHGKRGE